MADTIFSPALGPDISRWTRIGGQLGSTAGGLYHDSGGVRWYVKLPPSDDHARNECLANRLYRLAGADVPEVMLIAAHGRLAVASRVIKGLMLGDLSGDAAQACRAAVCDDFAADAWLGNRDVLGADLDNVLVGGHGAVVRIDQGGALRYRAQGALKADFGREATEFETLRDPAKNATAAALFGAMTPAQLAASVAKVASLDAAAIRDTVLGVYGPGDDAHALAEILIARQADLKRRADALAFP